ncbi:18907_t:CDS:2, partial [Dentiscutata erythropus]
EEKNKVVELTCHISNSYAAWHYSLDLTMLGCWVKKFFQTPHSSQKNIQSIGSGCHVLFSKKESQLFNTKKTKDKFKRLAIEKFNISTHWFVICLCQKNDYFLEMIANMNKMPVYFDIAGVITVNTKDAKTVHPLDIYINKPFKDKLYKYWYRWMTNGGNEPNKEDKESNENYKTGDENETSNMMDNYKWPEYWVVI